MATLPLATDSHGIPYLANADTSGVLAIPTERYFKNSNGAYVPVAMQELFIFNALAITDTSQHVSSQVDLSCFKSLTFIAVCSLNQVVAVYPQIDSVNTALLVNGSWSATNTGITIPLGAQTEYILNDAFPALLNRPLKNIRFVASCPTAPTSGSLSIKVWGIPN